MSRRARGLWVGDAARRKSLLLLQIYVYVRCDQLRVVATLRLDCTHSTVSRKILKSCASAMLEKTRKSSPSAPGLAEHAYKPPQAQRLARCPTLMRPSRAHLRS